MPSIDPAKMGSWFDAYAGRLVLYARQWLEAQWAEDVVQDVFIRLMAQSRELAVSRGSERHARLSTEE